MTVRTYEDSQSVVVEIQDQGPGISAENFEKIFDPFFTTKPPGEGTGLGLAVSKRILEIHGAAIEIKNQTQGGVCATVFFPRNGGFNHVRKEDDQKAYPVGG